MEDKGEIILYQPEESIRLQVLLENDTVWLNRAQLSELFGRDVKTIGKHIKNALLEELKDIPTVAKFATVQKEGDRLVTREVEYYSLDMILSIGYRVKSQRGILFRQWANKVLKDYLLNGYSINNRIEHLEQRVSKTEERISFFVRTALPPTEGIFFDGQIFDAYTFVSNLIKSAKKKIVLIDNYIDETVLVLLDKRIKGVKATIYTTNISSQLHLDINRHNKQYSPIEVKDFNHSHDRFLIIDEDTYHIGASLKDLGKRWFAFSKLQDITTEEILKRLEQKSM